MTKVVMIVRSTFYTSKGGDTIQVFQTAAHLAGYNISVDIKLTNEKIQYGQYDLLHFFNITRPADILYHIRKAEKPFFVSTILIDYSEYDKYHRKGFAGLLFRFLTADGIEYLKTISRWISGRDKLMSMEYLWRGQRSTITEILKHAALLLPNSDSEYKRLIQQYTCGTDHIVVPNGVDTGLFSYNNKIEKDPRLILCVARVEGVKNQVNLIRALKNTNFNLVIIGAVALNQTSYYQTCRDIATGNIHFIEHLPQEELVSYYQKAKVHVLPSWFETTGLSSLEAAVMGCNIVISDKGDTREYFGSDAIYCDPGSPESIYDTVEKAAALSNNGSLQKKIRAHYSWEQATIRTMEAYKRVKGIWD
ncbi:MAG: glycosyltransferase family 4 protein [Bacteroidota bacterium]